MKIKNTILGGVLVAALAISSSAIAQSSSGSGSSNDGARGGSSGADRGDRGGELNHDNDLQGAENSSARHYRRHATPVGDVGIGEPTNPNNSFIESRELLRDRH